MIAAMELTPERPKGGQAGGRDGTVRTGLKKTIAQYRDNAQCVDRLTGSAYGAWATRQYRNVVATSETAGE